MSIIMITDATVDLRAGARVTFRTLVPSLGG
ncbi:hypothetical protein J3R03_004009 [Actinoplanes couchii]|nr:hypothetical protein [Actinoplanes couchii]